MRIKTITTEIDIYIDSNGKETPLQDLHDSHLLSAYAKAVIEDRMENVDILLPRKLKGEILRRMKKTNEQETTKD